MLYKFTNHYNDWFKHYNKIKDAKLNLFTALQGLGSEESKKIVATYDEAREKGRNKYGSYGGLYRELADVPLEEIVESITEWIATADKGFVEAKGLAEQVKELEAKQEELERDLEFEQLTAETHLDEIKRCEEWEQNKRKDLEIELDSKSEKLQEFIEKLAKEIVENKKLRAESEGKSEKLKEINERKETKKRTAKWTITCQQAIA